MKIGKSLSFCVKDICDGNVALEDVDHIVAGTAIENKYHLSQVINEYKLYYWKKYPDEAERIARFLFENWKIVQPRLHGMPSTNILSGIWEGE